MNVCFYCRSPDRELRPYGPGGSCVCEPCAFETIERAEATRKAYVAMLGAITGPAILTPDGPEPLRGEE